MRNKIDEFMLKGIILFGLIFLLVPSLVSAQSISGISCYDNITVLKNFTLSGTSNQSIYYYQTCQFGCDNTTGDCSGIDSSSSINAMWITYATGALFLVLGTVLGIPYGNKTKGFDTTIVVKYSFFFIGLFLMYLSLSMSYRNTQIYGGESNILGGVNTSIMVIMITLLLFLFIFFVELFFGTIKTMWESRKAEKWQEREESE